MGTVSFSIDQWRCAHIANLKDKRLARRQLELVPNKAFHTRGLHLANLPMGC